MVQLEYEVGPLTVNFRVLLEPKGFLRIILLFIALLAFALTAGFNSVGGTANSVTCLSLNTSTNYTASLSFYYPFMFTSYSIVPSVSDSFIGNNSQCVFTDAATLPLSGSAQFFVALGVLTVIYVVGAILVYMLFITPELFLAKWLVIGDFICTILFGVLYAFASLAWSIGAAQLNTYITELLQTYAVGCFQCDANTVGAINPRTQAFTVAAVAALFGWLASFIWLASVWFVYKDTMWHKDETGPLASLYRLKKGSGGDTQEKREESAEDGEE